MNNFDKIKNMQDHITALVKYNLWANKIIADFVVKAGEKIADEQLISSFPSIRKTLYHLWDGQEIWRKRLLGESSKTWPSHNFNGTLPEAIDLFHKSSESFVRFVTELPQNGKNSIIKYYAMNGDEFQNSIEEIIMHLMNHGTYHRGQLITMLRTAGYESVGSTDFIRFYGKHRQSLNDFLM